MPDFLSPDERIRIAALEGAGRCVEPGTSTSTLLSRASQCETYVRTGLIRTGPKWEEGTEVGVTGLSVMVYGPNLDPAMTGRLHAMVQEASV